MAYMDAEVGNMNEAFEDDDDLVRFTRLIYLTEPPGFLPTDGVAWMRAVHTPQESRYLTLDDPIAETPASFKGELYLPQKLMLATMVALEQRPVLTLESSRIHTRIARVAEKFSFGKTVLSLALVCAQRIPAKLPAIYHGCCDGAHIFMPEITIRYTRFLPITLVIASSNIISQWVANTQKFTNLRYFVIDHVRTLRKFEEIYRHNVAADIDLIFMKAGRVTSTFVVDGEVPAPADTKPVKDRSLFEVFAAILEGIPVARLIIDDYDTLKLTQTDQLIPALFTWVISATMRRRLRIVSAHKPVVSVEDHYRQRNITPVINIAHDDNINSIFKLCCSPALVDAHINSTKITYRRYVVQGGYQAVKILRQLNLPEEVIEMLNAGAIDTAATTMGITTTNIGDIIHRAIGTHLGKLQNELRTLTRLEHIVCIGKSPVDEPVFREAIRHGSDADIAALFSTIRSDSNLTSVIHHMRTHSIKLRDEYSITLSRMRDNIREGQCQCCMVPFSVEPVYVLIGCCQIIICEHCVIHTTPKGRSFIGVCPNCQCAINYDTGIIRVGAEISLDVALTDDVVASAADATAAPDDAAAAPTKATKLTVLLQLIQNVEVKCISTRIECGTHTRMLEGKRDIPWPADMPHKYLIFTMHSESTLKIAAELERLNIAFCTMNGARTRRDAAVQAFQSTVNIMLITAAKDCAGLDLPFISHVVFYHRVLDKNIEDQVAARGQRLGRTHNLEIVSIFNEAEI